MQVPQINLERLKNPRSWRLSVKLLLGTIAVLVLFTIVLNLLVDTRTRTSLEASVGEEVSGTATLMVTLLTQRGAASIDGRGVLTFGATSMADLSLVDSIKRTTGDDASFFQLQDGVFVRQGTTLLNDDGTRLGGVLVLNSAIEPLLRGEKFQGRVVLAGKEYLNVYLPIRDSSGKIVGAAVAGKPFEVIDAQVADLNRAILLVSAALLLVSLALTQGLIYLVITKPLATLERAAARIGAGDYDVRLPIVNQDEIGQVSQTVNSMVDRIVSEERAQAEENASMQRQIMHLLDEVGTAAEGDLTVEAEVTADALGSVADSFNYMIGELRGIIGRVNAATQQVGNSTDEILATTDSLSRAAEQQAARIADTSTAVEEMAVSIQQVSENAAISAQVAREARATVGVGNKAVDATITGMERIREQVRETATKIEQLGASSQEIGAIVSLIQEVADQTELLALNAAIEAAMAGEHGRGFAVVAEEVRRLAERTSAASQQIAILVKGIQTDTSEAIVAMANGTNEVTTGARLAAEAGQSLARIDATAVQLAELIEAISLAAEQQARASAGIARAMGEISSVTSSTTAGTQQAAASVADLAALADDLRSSVAAFRLEAAEATEAPGGRGQGLGEAEHWSERGRVAELARR